MGGRVEGKVALISGGARGQGASHGRLLARHGARVVLGDILDQAGEETARRLRGDGLEVRYVHLDVTPPGTGMPRSARPSGPTGSSTWW